MKRRLTRRQLFQGLTILLDILGDGAMEIMKNTAFEAMVGLLLVLDSVSDDTTVTGPSMMDLSASLGLHLWV